MILKNKKSISKVNKPIDNDDLDELLKELNEFNVSLKQKGSLVKEPEEKKKD